MRMFANPGRLWVNRADGRMKTLAQGSPMQAFLVDLSIGAAHAETTHVDRCPFQDANNKNLGGLRCRNFVER